MGIVDPSIRSLEVETGARVSQQRFHWAHLNGLGNGFIVGMDPRSEILKFSIQAKVAKNPMENGALQTEIILC